jgi:transposase
MTAPVLPRPSSEQDEVILGADTHKEIHVAAVVTAVGATVATGAFPANAQGYCQLLNRAQGHGDVRRAGVEGTGSYGAALTRYLSGEGIAVIEVNRPDRAARRSKGKTNVVDAEAAGRAVLSGRATGATKAGHGPIKQLRVYKIAKDSAARPARRPPTNSRRSWSTPTRSCVSG